MSVGLAENGRHAIDLKVGLVALPEVVAANLAEEARLDAEVGESVDGVGGAATRHDGRVEALHGLDNLCRALIIDELHAALGEGEVGEYVVIGHADEDVDERIAHSENFRFHRNSKRYGMRKS